MQGDDQRTSNKRGRTEDDDEKGTMGRLEKRPSVVEEYSYSYSGDEMINGVKYEEEKETTTPVSASAVTTTGSGSGTGTGTGMGLFDQLITNLVNSPRADNHHAQSEKFDNVGDAVEDGGGEDGKEGGESGSIIDNIVAKLPRTLSEDTGPATDEASILIHSIIHD